METTLLTMTSGRSETIEQMKAQYPDQWLLIAFTALDANLKVIAGEVLAHSVDRDEIYAALSQRNGRSFGIEHTGSPDPDLAFLLP